MQQSMCNIGKWNRIYRLTYSAFCFFGAFLVIRTVEMNHFELYWKALAFVPFFFAFLNIFQAYFGICVKHARKGTKDMR